MRKMVKKVRRTGVTKMVSKHKRSAIVGATGFIASIVVILSVTSAPILQRMALHSPQVAAVVSAMLVDLLNTDRTAQKLGDLTVNPLLVAAAQAKANDMAAKGYFAHIAPDGKDSWYWFDKAGYDYAYAGENLAVDFSESADVERAWMNSPTHRENLLNPHYTEIGIATAVGTYQGHQTIFAVQMFGSPASAALPDTPKQEFVPVSPTVPAETSKGKVAQKPAIVAPPKKTVLAAEIKPAPAMVVTQNGPSVTTHAIEVRGPIAQAAGSPKLLMRYLFFILVGLLLAALAIETELEFKMHHIRRAMMTGGFAVAFAVVFALANTWYLPTPIISMGSAMTTSVAAALGR